MSKRMPCVLLIVGWLQLPARAQVVEQEDGEVVQSPAPKSAKADGVESSRVVDMVVRKTNEFRKQEGKQAVEVNDELTKTAQYFADYMARTGEYGHTADGSRPAQRAKDHGYQYCIVSENIAYQYSSAGFATSELGTGFFEGWKESPGHRKNMLDPDVTETGVAVARSEDTGYYYAVQMFGRPRSQAIQFKIANRADAEVEYRIGDSTYTLPPRYTRTHQRCRPSDVAFQLPTEKPEAKKREETVRPKDGDRLVVTASAEGYAVKKE